MKKTRILLFAVLTVLFVGCTSNAGETSEESLAANELILKGKQFAKIHNEGLEYIYESTHKLQTRTTEGVSFDFYSAMVDATNSFIAMKVANTRTSPCDMVFVTKEMYDSISIEDIKARMSPKELEYTNFAIENMGEIEPIVQNVAHDSELSENQKFAVICFLTTLEASKEYWEANIDKWIIGEYGMMKTRARFEFDLKTVIGSDAYWGYTGLLQSGMNVYVGGGAAALGSALSCIR